MAAGCMPTSHSPPSRLTAPALTTATSCRSSTLPGCTSRTRAASRRSVSPSSATPRTAAAASGTMRVCGVSLIAGGTVALPARLTGMFAIGLVAASSVPREQAASVANGVAARPSSSRRSAVSACQGSRVRCRQLMARAPA